MVAVGASGSFSERWVAPHGQPKVPSPRWWRFLALRSESPWPLPSAGLGRRFPRPKELSLPPRIGARNCVTAVKGWAHGIAIFLPVTFYNMGNAAEAGYQIRRPANCGKMVLRYSRSNCYSLLMCSFVLRLSQFRHLLCSCAMPQCYCFTAAWLFRSVCLNIMVIFKERLIG